MKFELSADTKVIRSVLEEAKVGDIVTYETLSKAIGRDVREFAMGAINSARRILLNEKRYVFECVQKIGYKRLDDSNIVKSMERDRRHIAKYSGRSLKKLECVAFNALSKEEQKTHTVAAAQFGVLRMMAKDAATKRIEERAVKANTATLAIGETLGLFTNDKA